jgi:hypothetical protein
MNFTPDTLVSDAIKADPGVVDRLVTLNPTFRKLRNPVLRRVMGRLVSFRDAARVADVPLAQIMRTVNGEAYVPLGNSGQEQEKEELRPNWMAGFTAGGSEKLDVRPALAAGEEPLGMVMKESSKVKEGDFFEVIAPFNPAPLRRVLARKGFVSYGKCIAGEEWQIVFLRDSALAAAVPVNGEVAARQWQESGICHIDVRGLDPPNPMLAIIALIETQGMTGPIIVHHEREPIFLYPELAERGWRHEIIAGEPGEVRLRLTSGTAS